MRQSQTTLWTLAYFVLSVTTKGNKKMVLIGGVIPKMVDHYLGIRIVCQRLDSTPGIMMRNPIQTGNTRIHNS